MAWVLMARPRVASRRRRNTAPHVAARRRRAPCRSSVALLMSAGLALPMILGQRRRRCWLYAGMLLASASLLLRLIAAGC